MYILKLLMILHLLVSMQIEILTGENPQDTKAIPIIVQITVSQEEIKPGKSGTCGGSYIKPNWVLSATHCVSTHFPLKNHKPKFDVKLCMGLIEAKCPEPFVRFADELWPHTEGAPAYKEHNILLIKVLTPWVLGPTIKLAKLPTTKVSRKTYDKKKCMVGGWGRPDGPLKQGTVTIYVGDPDKCEVENERQLCAASDTGITYQGDSGGPLVCNGILVGVLQGGYGDCNSTLTKTNFFNMVQAYQDWIVRIAGAGNSIVPNKLCLCIFLVIPLAIFN